MPKEEKVLFESHPEFPMDTKDLVHATINTLLTKASKEPLTIELQNGPKTPFRIISKPGGGVMWGAGGCGIGG